MRVKIRPLLFWLCAALILLIFQGMILSKEKVKSSGRALLLELAPVDPRSLMQGDYMRLAYALEEEVRRLGEVSSSPKGFILVQPDAQGYAHFVDFAEAPPTKKKDRHELVAIPCRFDAYGRAHIQPDSFFFQEGLAKHYEQARYALFHCTPEGDCLLMDLADAAGKALGKS